MANPIAIDAQDLQYYDKQIKKYIDDKDTELKASLSNISEIDKRIDEIAEKTAAHSATLISHREELDDIEAAILVLQNDDKSIHNEVAELKAEIQNKLDESAMEYLATKEFVKSEIANAELSGKEIDLTNYYTKSEIDAKLPDISNLATKEEVEAVQNIAGQNSVKLFAIESDLFDIEKKLETIPSIEGLASEQFVLDKISEIEIPEVPTKVSELENDAGYVTASDTQDVYYLDFTGYTANDSLNAEHSEFFEKLVNNQNVTGYIRAGRLESNSYALVTRVQKGQYAGELGWTVTLFTSPHTHAGHSFKYFKANIELHKPDTFWRFKGCSEVISDELATEQFVRDSIDAINIPEIDLSNYYNRTEVDSLIDGITIPTVPTNISAFTNDANYATEQYVLDHVNTQIEAEVETQVTEVVEKQVTEVVQTQVKDEVAEQLAKNEKINYGTFGEV